MYVTEHAHEYFLQCLITKFVVVVVYTEFFTWEIQTP